MEEFIIAFVEPPTEMMVTDIDLSTITLSADGTVLATAESPTIVENALIVHFGLDLANASDLLGTEVTEVEVDGSKIKVKGTTLPTQAIDLLDLVVSGELDNGDVFYGVDSVRVMHQE